MEPSTATATATKPIALPGIGKFALALVVFAIIYFVLPANARPWFALVIVLGAVASWQNAGALEKFGSYLT